MWAQLSERAAPHQRLPVSDRWANQKMETASSFLKRSKWVCTANSNQFQLLLGAEAEISAGALS